MFSTYDINMFSKKILEIRKNLGYSRDYVSKMSGVNSDTIRKIEMGEVLPRFETLELLSIIYKVNLLQVLDQYKPSTIISDFYDSIDHYISGNEVYEIQSIIKDFYQIHQKENSQLLFDQREIQQLTLFFNALELLYFEEASKYSKGLELLVQAIQVTIPSFKIEKWKDFSYNHLEIRILYCIASTLIPLGNYQRSLDLLEWIIKRFDLSKYSKLHEKFTIIKTYALISYNYHMLDKFEDSLSYANTGIEYCLKNSIMHNLPLLLSRKGVALYKLKDGNFKEYLDQGVQLLRIQNNHILADLYAQVNLQYATDTEL